MINIIIINKENCISGNTNIHSQINDMSVEDYKPLQK